MLKAYTSQLLAVNLWRSSAACSDVWVDLWGKPFADDQVRIESLRKGIVDYQSLWKKTLAQPATERARRLREILGGRLIQ